MFLPSVLVAAVVVALLQPSPGNLPASAKVIQQRVLEAEQWFKKINGEPGWTSAPEKQDAITNLAQQQNIGLFYYRGDSLVYWTDHRIAWTLPPRELPEGTSFLRLKSGWYVIMKSQLDDNMGTLVGAAVMKYQYPFENDFLKNRFATTTEVPRDIEISEEAHRGSIAVKNEKGERLFSVYRTEVQVAAFVNPWLLAAQFILLLLAFYYVHFFAARMARKNGFAQGFAYLFFSVLLVRGVMLVLNQPSEFYYLELFHPQHYASSSLFKSLGDLLINSLLIIWLVLFAALYLPPGSSRKPFRLPAAFVAVGLIFGMTAAVAWVFKTLVIDSVISFEVYNILSLSAYSFMGLVTISILLLAHFIISKYLVNRLQHSAIRWNRLVGIVVGWGILYGAYALFSNYWQAIVFSALWGIFFVLALYRITEQEDNFSVRRLLIYMALYSFLSAYLVENLYEHHERSYRQFFAGKLVTERDYVAEFMFEDIHARMVQDAFLRNYFSNPLIPEKELNDRLNSLYFSGYFNKYDVKVFAYDRYDCPIRNPDTLAVDYFAGLNRYPEDSLRQLHYISDTNKNFFYLSVIPFREDTLFTGKLVVQLKPKVFYGQNVYPELLLGGHVSTPSSSTRYHYAIYRHDQLVIQYGEYPYTYFWNSNFTFDKTPYRFIDIGEWEHIIYRFNNDMKVIVTEHQEGLFEPVATFSYLFSLYFLMGGLVLGLFRYWKSEDAGEGEFTLFSVSFRTRINYSILLMIVTSFVIITIVTISFLSKQYDNNYTDRLLRKEKVIHSGVEYFIRENIQTNSTPINEGFRNQLSLEIARQSEINNIDINLFDASGNLYVTSQPAIYERGLISRKMNSDAYFRLSSGKASQVTEEETIGLLKYLTTYAPIRSATGETIAYLGIPYFSRSKNINEEVSSFLVALMNVYVFLLICAAILAYFISNSITRPLSIISEKLRKINLSKQNEPIQWNSQDEIGALVKEYNKMISELEHSAQELAKGERESAWREMAKQIAHEIKNPLTPMKLSIQYLQRAIDAGDPNIAQLSRKVARTLEEQIENLSSIATAFSSFAKMPKTHNELINLNELLKSIADLFSREEKTIISFTTDSESPVVYADKNQLVSVFNNLVKNALQSIPEHRAGFIDLHISEEEGWIITTVSDNGTGIPRDLYDKVFVPNFTTKSSGTGLGLAITKQMVDGAGGRIWFESAENIGTTFYVRLRKKVDL